MNYYDKYIKYKRKYINLKNMIGSGRDDIPEYYRCNHCDENKIFQLTYKGTSKKICLECKNELQQVKYFECPNLEYCSIADNGPFILPFLGKEATCRNCRAPLKKISKKEYNYIKETRKYLDSGKGKKSVSGSTRLASTSAATASAALDSYKTFSIGLSKDAQVLISNIETKENSDLNGITGVITEENSDGTYIVNITEGAGVSTHIINGDNLTPYFFY